MTKDTEKDKVLNAFFALVFTVKVYLQDLQACGSVWNNEDLPGGESDQGTFKQAVQTVSPWGLMGCTHECCGG